MNTLTFNKQHYSMTSYLNKTYDLNSDELIEVIDEMPFWSAPFGLELLNNISLKKNITALDIGFGAGFPLTEIALRLGNTCKVYGLDPWEAAIKRAKKKIKAYGIKNVKIIKGVSENIPLPDNAVDLIVSNNGINNVSDLQRTLAECKRVLKPGGEFIQTINLEKSMYEFYNCFESILKAEGMTNELAAMKEHIYEKRKPLNEFKNILTKAGFSIKKVKNHEFKYSFVDGTTMFNHYFIQLAFLDSWKELIKDVDLENIFSKVEHSLNQKAEKDGFLKLTIPFIVVIVESKLI